MSRYIGTPCSRCGKFVGKDGTLDIAKDFDTGMYEMGYPECGACLRRNHEGLKDAAPPAGPIQGGTE